MSKPTLLAALKACDNNRSELARRLGVKRQQIQNWLRTDYGPPSWHLEAVARVARARK